MLADHVLRSPTSVNCLQSYIWRRHLACRASSLRLFPGRRSLTLQRRGPMSGLIQNAIDQLDGMRAQASGSAGQAAPADKKAPKENGSASAAVQQAPAGKQKTSMGGDAKDAKGGKQQKKGKQDKPAKTAKQPAPPHHPVVVPLDLATPVPRGQTGSVPSIRAELTAAFQLALGKTFPTAQAQAIVTPTAERDAKFGDYQCNNAMALFGKLKGQPGAPSNPRAAAEALVQALPSTSMLEGTPSLAGPGFINLKVTQDFLGQRITAMLKEGIATWAPRLTRQRVVVDFSSPNVAKEMHVGHLRSTIIGDTIARTLEFCGADVLRLNHIGDWGTQFGMLIEHLNETRSGGLADPSIADMSIAELQSTYKAAKAHFDEDADFKDRARRGVTKLQGGDPAYLAAWERICEASRKAFSAIYARLGVTLQERGESFYNPRLRGAVEELQAMGVAEESEGAVVVWAKPGQPPLMVQKSDGGFGYATTDMAAIKQRLHDEKGDWIIYVTDAGQAEHFASVFAAARKAGYLGDPADPATPWVSHVGFGTVQGEDGKKFKTRSGETVRLVELLDEARDRCLATIKERRGDDIQQEELEHAAAAMGYGAVKYADLRNNRTTNYRFSFDAMLELQGNTAVYLLYAHARIAAIGRKAGIEDIAALAQDHSVHIEHEKECALALHVVRFPEALENALDELMPNRLTEYLYDLSDKFTGFYTECKVVGNEQQTSRLLLCEATAVVMRQCFSLLGITPLYRI